jgi:dTDP-4-amino-4,6-dideoxygalactose transaminase
MNKPFPPVERASAARSAFLPFHRPDLAEAEIDAVAAVLRSGWLTTGAEARAFEAEFAEAVGAPFALALNSCTAALHLALEAGGIAPGDEVLVPTMTFAATAEVVCYLKARPVLVDCEPDSLNISAEAAAAAVCGRTKALIPVHYGGQPCDLDAMQALAQRHRLVLIEDAAHAFPAAWAGRPIGSHGNLTCFSFYATKNITTGEGGMVTSHDEQLMRRMRRMSLHGISHDAWKRYTAEGSWYYEIQDAGFKYNLTDIAAALGRVQLRRAEAMRARRRELAARYAAGLAGTAAVELPAAQPRSEHAWHLYPLRLRLDQLRIDRARFIAELRARNIGASVHFIPLHLHPFYRNQGWRAEDFPVATREYERLISLPLYSAMRDADCDDVIAAVQDIALQFQK